MYFFISYPKPVSLEANKVLVSSIQACRLPFNSYGANKRKSFLLLLALPLYVHYAILLSPKVLYHSIKYGAVLDCTMHSYIANYIFQSCVFCMPALFMVTNIPLLDIKSRIGKNCVYTRCPTEPAMHYGISRVFYLYHTYIITLYRNTLCGLLS